MYEYQFSYRMPGPVPKRMQFILAHDLTDAMRHLPRQARNLSYRRVNAQGTQRLTTHR